MTRDSYSCEIETAIGFFHPDDRDAVRTVMTTATRGDERRSRFHCG